jgi:hypothetical protein
MSNIGSIYKNFSHHHKNTPNNTRCTVWSIFVMLRKILVNAANITQSVAVGDPNKNSLILVCK